MFFKKELSAFLVLIYTAVISNAVFLVNFHDALAEPVLLKDYATHYKKQAHKLWVQDHLELIHAYEVLKRESVPLSEVNGLEDRLLLTQKNAIHHALDKIMSETLGALDLVKAEDFVQASKKQEALLAFYRATQNLPKAQWVYFWKESTSKALFQLCFKNTKPEPCLQIAKQVVDAFPRGAKEVAPLGKLFPFEFSKSTDANGDRLTQTYTEKTEKDESDFTAILTAYLNQEHSDLKDLVEEFLKNYPKSALRFRAQFLLAESFTQKGKTDSAKELYQKIINDTPLSFYALVAAERLGVSLKDQIKKDPLKIDPKTFNLNFLETKSLERVEYLLRAKKTKFLNLEIGSFLRLRNYSTDFLLYLISLSQQGEQYLAGFRLINELLQRQYPNLLQEEFLRFIFPTPFEKIITTKAQDNKINPLWVLSLTKQESGFKSDILSVSGAMGLMQLMPFTALEVKKDMTLSQSDDPKINIDLGTQYLAKLIQRFNGNMVFALAGYNAGPHRVLKWQKDILKTDQMIPFIEAIPFKETREYVMSILRNYYWYQVIKGQKPDSVFASWALTPELVPSK